MRTQQVFVFMLRVEPQTYRRTACDYKFSGESLSSRVTFVSYLELRWMQPFPCPSFLEGGFHSWPILLALVWSCEGLTLTGSRTRTCSCAGPESSLPLPLWPLILTTSSYHPGPQFLPFLFLVHFLNLGKSIL